MALLFIDGFDHYTSTTIAKWDVGGGTLDATAGRRGGGALKSPNTAAPAKTISSNPSTIIVGMAASAPSAGTTTFLDLYDSVGGGVQVQFGFNSDGSIYCNRGGNGAGYGPPGGTLIATTPVASTTYGNAWHYLEFKVTISDTVGAITIRVDGAVVLNVTGLDTKNTANAWANQVRIGSISASVFYIDDLYICDTTGSAPQNDFLGDIRIDTLYPNADGTYSQLTPSTGTTHYTLVDETNPNTTDYNESATVGQRDTYNVQDVTISGTIYGVQVDLSALKNDSGSRSMKSVVKSGSTIAYGANNTLSTSLAMYKTLLQTDPNTGTAWTQTTVNAVEIGMEVA